VSTFETKVKSQDEEINKLKESNDYEKGYLLKLLNSIQLHDIENSSSF
jgi:hypothetical protein